MDHPNKNLQGMFKGMAVILQEWGLDTQLPIAAYEFYNRYQIYLPNWITTKTAPLWIHCYVPSTNLLVLNGPFCPSIHEPSLLNDFTQQGRKFMFKLSLHFQNFIPIIVATSSSHHEDPEVTKLPEEKAVTNKQYGVGKYLISGLKSIIGCWCCGIFCKNFIDDIPRPRMFPSS